MILTKPHALITGASAGLGAALAKRFASQGYNLTLSARRRDRLEELRNELAKRFPESVFFIKTADVTKKEDMRELIDESVKKFSNIDVLIANAGLGMWTRFRDLKDPDDVQNLMQLNYMGVVYALHYALPYLTSSKGSFVAISSIQGVVPVAYHTGYVASKHAVNGFIETIRLEEPAIHFLLVMPGWISGTELRKQALSGVGEGAIKVKTSHNRHAISAEDCAEKISEALRDKKRSLFIPSLYHYAPMLRFIAPISFDNFVMKKIAGQLHS